MGNWQSKSKEEEIERNGNNLSDSTNQGPITSREQSEKISQLSQKYRINEVTLQAPVIAARSLMVMVEGCTTMSIGLPQGDFTSAWLNNQFLRKCTETGRNVESKLYLYRFSVFGNSLQKLHHRLAAFHSRSRNKILAV